MREGVYVAVLWVHSCGTGVDAVVGGEEGRGSEANGTDAQGDGLQTTGLGASRQACIPPPLTPSLLKQS